MKQRGHNPIYPDEIDTWRLGEKVPDWIIDRCKVKKINLDGTVDLDLKQTNTGGYGLIISGTNDVLLYTKNLDDYICYSKTHPIFSLTKTQLNLLYI